jgi:Zn-dependent peptidase ImmA (M78 family)
MYRIVLVSQAEMEQLHGHADGLTDLGNATIYLLDTLPPDRFRATLFHELIHAGMDTTIAHVIKTLNVKNWTDDKEEAIVRATETALVPALAALGWRPTRRRKDPGGA